MVNIKIVHLCLQAPYNDYWGYQDNLLPKYHKKLGYEVTVITTNTLHQDGKIVKTNESNYYLKDGEKIIRKAYESIAGRRFSEFIKYYKIHDLICEEKPDIIFVHGLGNLSVLQVAKYVKKNNECKVIADNHVDYYNESPQLQDNILKRNIIVTVFKGLNKYMQKYYQKVYGVTPWRLQYQKEIFGISNEKSDLLVLGADDDKIKYKDKSEIKKNIRRQFDISEDSFLIVSGGKIDETKNIHLLIKAVNSICNDKICLIIFGNIDDNVMNIIGEDYDKKRIKLIGWVESDSVYNYFLASDLIVFPGTHSVLWEQACACGIPGLFKHWNGMEHVNVGGNCEFLFKDSEDEILEKINLLYSDKNAYLKMKEIAENKGRNLFLYSQIAKKSLESVK